MGAGGTALAVASSDIVLMTDSIRSIPQVGLRDTSMSTPFRAHTEFSMEPYSASS